MKPGASAFARLRELQHALPAPPGRQPIQLHLGELQLARAGLSSMPSALIDAEGWTRYPPLGGTAELREAYRGWLERRFGLSQAAAGSISVEPTAGTKQAVAVAITQAVERARRLGHGESPVVVMPNPFYPTYYAAAVAASARPVFYRVGDAEQGSVGPADPVADAVAKAGGRAAAIVLCNPGNPQGGILSEDFLRAAARSAAAADAVLLVDECYTDLSHGRRPPGYLPLAALSAVEPTPYLVLHSLSKRSGAPGLRSGFAAGHPETVSAYAEYNRACGVSTPLPVCAAAAALWRDEAHVQRTRDALAANWRLADEILGGIASYRRAEAGFFLWLPVEHDESAAGRLWREQALSVMPGSYLAAEDPDGANPGAGRLRIALVHDEPLMRTALLRLRAGLASGPLPQDSPPLGGTQ
jgi:N-succinyldiaminopimelate aminotransferase